jgi:hypothetical protein
MSSSPDDPSLGKLDGELTVSAARSLDDSNSCRKDSRAAMR